jgi:NRAMP (natural resistance-associated macrophage protein)-like metal ion transporter
MLGEAARRSSTSVAEPTFTPPAERRSVLDRAHVGDIEGALGTIESSDTGPRRSTRGRLAMLLAVMGPGLVVMVADNDAGGLSIYAQAGQNYGASLLWVLLLLAPALFINQEMVARLGAVSGAGHARLIVERFGRRWGAFAIGDLLLLNALTIVTEFIGVALALSYFGVSRYVAVPVAAGALLTVIAGGSFRRWERAMYVMVSLSIVVVPLALLAHAGGHAPTSAGLLPGVEGGLSSTSILLIIALAGTTVAPWQLFFQQSNVVDKRITPRWLSYERVDTLIGTILVTLGAVAIMLACAWAFAGSRLHGSYRDAGAVADGLHSSVSPLAGTLFAVALLDASILGAAAVTLASSYAIGDYFGFKHSLHRDWKDATTFHGTYAASIAIAAIVVLLRGAPLGLITTGVQALAGILLPSATVFLLLLCNDRDVLGPWTNPRWLNALAALVVGILVVLSTMLTITTLFPHADVAVLSAVLFATMAVVLVASATASARGGRPPGVSVTTWERHNWTTPPLETLPPPARSRIRRLALIVLRAQLISAAALLVAKLLQLGLGA